MCISNLLSSFILCQATIKVTLFNNIEWFGCGGKVDGLVGGDAVNTKNDDNDGGVDNEDCRLDKTYLATFKTRW